MPWRVTWSPVDEIVASPREEAGDRNVREMRGRGRGGARDIRPHFPPLASPPCRRPTARKQRHNPAGEQRTSTRPTRYCFKPAGASITTSSSRPLPPRWSDECKRTDIRGNDCRAYSDERTFTSTALLTRRLRARCFVDGPTLRPESLQRRLAGTATRTRLDGGCPTTAYPSAEPLVRRWRTSRQYQLQG